MENRTIEIVYVATNGYCMYADKFFETIRYFAPGVKKVITILSNGLEKYDGYCGGDIIRTKVIKIFDLIYPCINLNKSYLIEQLPPKNADYIFYFDADTMFKNVPNYDWEQMFSDMDKGSMLISKHPMYAAKDTFSLYGVSKKDWIDNFYTTNMTEKDKSRASYIDADKYTYVISSFFAASTNVMHRINQEVIRLTRYDLTRSRRYHIPQYMDENYFNSLVYDYEKFGKQDFLFSVKQYSELNNADSDEYDTVFIYQKNFEDYKTNRR